MTSNFTYKGLSASERVPVRPEDSTSCPRTLIVPVAVLREETSFVKLQLYNSSLEAEPMRISFPPSTSSVEEELVVE